METQPPITGNTAVSPVPPLVPKDKLFKIAIIIGILIVIGLFGNIYLFITRKQAFPVVPVIPAPIPTQIQATPTIDPTSNWETYMNSEKGYSVKYPKDTFVRLICPGEELDLSIKSQNDKKDVIEMPTCDRGGRYNIEIKTYTEANKRPLYEVNEKYYSLETKNILVDGVNAQRYVFIPLTDKTSEDEFPVVWYTKVIINHSGKIYEIFLGNKEYLVIFDQILSTFTFLP